MVDTVGIGAELEQPFAPQPWRPGEHVTIVGDTGTGKTYLVSRLVRMRRYVVVYKPKGDPDDDTKWRGFRRAKTAKVMDDARYERIVLEPRYRSLAIEGWRALETAWRHGGWTVVIDEQLYAERFGLREQIERLLMQGRSQGITAIIGMQRPVMATRFAISQSTHFFTFRIEGRDIKTVMEATTPRIGPLIEGLGEYEFAYYNRRTRQVTTGRANRLGRVISQPRTLDSGSADATVRASAS